MQLEIGGVNPHAVICKACKGFCCFRFWIDLPVTKSGVIQWDKVKSSDIEFAKENFIRKCSRFHSEGRRSIAFQCRKYDVEKGICTCYDDRPILCQKYVCDVACEGRCPEAKDWPYTTRAMKRAGMLV